ncbi:MAG: 16S rRNA (guanine(527)-N(7))-methyltransferase RsmG [Pseudobdellovibrionaceae bacterium]
MAHKNASNDSPYKRRQQRNPQPLAQPTKEGLKKPFSTSAKAPIINPASVSQRGMHKKPPVIFELQEANNRLFDVFHNHDFKVVNHEQRLQLADFYRLLMLEQENNNFTRLLTLKDIAIKHFIDSLLITEHTDLLFPLLDMGTGPGLPGIPLKILFPKQKIILAEGVQKRVEFLKKVRSHMRLNNLDIIGRNIKEDFMYPVQSVITRAVEDISNTLRNVQGCLQKGGHVVLMKGPNVDPEIHTAQQEWSAHYKLIENKKYFLPSTPYERRLVIFEKRSQPVYFVDEISEIKLLSDELSNSEIQRWKTYK